MLISSIRTWLGRSLWALMDQCLFALSNFLINLYLARWLTKEGYGSFALAYTVFLFIGVIHSSLFTDPMLVFGSGRYKEGQRSYLRSLLGIHWFQGWLGAALLIALVALAYWNNPARPAILALSLASGMLLFQWLMRRACYLRQQSGLAAAGGGIYLSIALVGIFVLSKTSQLGPIQALIVMAVASVTSAMFIQWRLFARGGLTEMPCPARRELIASHWDYGRWSIAAGVIGWIAGNVAMVSLPWWHGNSSTGELRAALNLILPIQQLLAAAGPLLVPFLVGKRESPSYLEIAFKCGLLFMLPPLLWTLALGIGGPFAGNLLYGGRYVFDRVTLILFGLQAAISSFGLIMATALRAMELPKKAFHGYAVSALISLVVGIPLIAAFAISGAAWGILISASSSTLVLTLTFVSVVRHTHLADRPSAPVSTPAEVS